MISYRTSDILKQIRKHTHIIVCFDLHNITSEVSNDFKMHKYTIPYAMTLDDSSNELVNNVNTYLKDEYRDRPLYVGYQTIVNNDEGEFFEVGDAFYENAMVDIKSRCTHILEDFLGYKIVGTGKGRDDFEVYFDVIKP